MSALDDSGVNSSHVLARHQSYIITGLGLPCKSTVYQSYWPAA